MKYVYSEYVFKNEFSKFEYVKVKFNIIFKARGSYLDCPRNKVKCDWTIPLPTKDKREIIENILWKLEDCEHIILEKCSYKVEEIYGVELLEVEFGE